MNLSQRGLDLIKSFEGYHRRLPDGNCIAYRCPAGVWTIGHGVTVGVKAGMIWTPKQAEEALQRELEGHERAVLRLVKVDLNQNQFDALVSFAYNVGNGALEKSTLLKKLNKGDYPGAQAEFMKWNKAAGKTLRGLSIRRAKEAALFAERVEEKEGDPLPQMVDEPAEPMSPGTKMAIAGAASGGAGAVVSSPPPIVTETVSNVSAWQTIGKTVSGMITVAMAYPLLSVAVFAVATGVIFWPQISSAFGRSE
jgi:GH24 family phage-related lysozyme (muramidase)